MGLAHLADEDLMQLVRRGDAAAFEMVYDRHATAASSLAYRMTGARSAAEDVVQEAFLSLWRSGAALRPRTRLGAHVGARCRPRSRDRRAAPADGPRRPARERRGAGGALRGVRADRRRGGSARRRRARCARRSARFPTSRAASSSRPTSAASRTLLGALSDGDHERFAAHLPGCAACGSEVAQALVAAPLLALRPLPAALAAASSSASAWPAASRCRAATARA